MDFTIKQINSSNIPSTQSPNFSFESWITQYWFVLLIVLAVLVVLCVLVCACIIRHKPRVPSLNHRSDNVSIPVDTHGYSSSQQSTTMPSLSEGSTPVPSPNSSQQSVRVTSSQSRNNSSNNRRPSPHLSSNSSDTLRPGAHSVSSNSSSTSLMGVAGHSPVERNRRTGPMVRVTSLPDVARERLRTAPSTVSVETSGKSGISYRFQPVANSDAIVEVGVTVHTPGDPEKAVRIATAAALAESARKLAQEAASFIDEEEVPDDHTHLRSSGRVSSSSRYPPTQNGLVRFHPTSDNPSYNELYMRGQSYTQPYPLGVAGPVRRSSDTSQYRRPLVGVAYRSDRKTANLDFIRNSDRRLAPPTSDVDYRETRMNEIRRKKISERLEVPLSSNLSLSPSTSTGLSSTQTENSSQLSNTQDTTTVLNIIKRVHSSSDDSTETEQDTERLKTIQEIKSPKRDNYNNNNKLNEKFDRLSSLSSSYRKPDRNLDRSSFYRQNSLPRFSRPYSPSTGERKLSLSRQSYEPHSLLPSPPPPPPPSSSVNVTVDV